jgi:Glycosyl hydrolase family 63 C-terminal domain
MPMNAEKKRQDDDRQKLAKWRKWGPYLSERQWGTVREDYSADGSAWDYFTHEASRSRAYRWGEDGIAGISEDSQRLCFAVAMWNEKDPILKERLFGLTGNEGNHGEDVKELYYYLDATPTHSYLKMLYKYPQGEFPYNRLVEENRYRGRMAPEFELIDTGLFDESRYFDVFVEYAKTGDDDILIQITAHNRGPQDAPLHLLPQVWFRNTWSWGYGIPKPKMNAGAAGEIEIYHDELGRYSLYAQGGQGDGEVLFCDNETNSARLYNTPPSPGFFKDAFHEYVIHGNKAAVNPDRFGTKAGVHVKFTIPSGQSRQMRLRLCAGTLRDMQVGFDKTFELRKREADEFYNECQQGVTDNDAQLVQRQAWAGMIWSKQYYNYNVRKWLNGDPSCTPPPPQRKSGRNSDWTHINNGDIISMPDKWEYPWYAAWDLGFHCIALAMIDPEFAKHQLILLTREWYMHPNGQLPAYEWAFGDVNPPVHAWAALRVYQIDRQANGGKGDTAFLERVYHKLLLNFTWWVNRKDFQGRNIFEGGFLGLDNIGVFDRSAKLPTGGFISQCDGTSWMAMYCLNLMRIAIELSEKTPIYQDLATKFFEHFLFIAAAMTNIGQVGINLWDDTDEFFYDVLCLPDGRSIPLKLRSMVGLIPLFAVEVLDPDTMAKVPRFKARLEWILNNRPDLASLVSRWSDMGTGETRLLSLLRGHRMKALLKRMLDETEFLSPYGVRALSKSYQKDPYVFKSDGDEFVVRYEPGESQSGLFGGNSNWRGPVWMPVNFLLVESLRKFHAYYGDDFKVECPTGSGKFMTIREVSNELAARLTRLFLKDDTGKRPVFNQFGKFQTDPNFADYVLFFEYFHGDTGRGVGAGHQTGWTGLVAALIHQRVDTVACPAMMSHETAVYSESPA